ncbi:MAG: putative lipid II flippase FtsW [Candidatus Omnitrophica bacterium]|nr:putative lipid II flippase FtsW [Candidatus Omnitrophota bacterium]MDD5653061.1 putative lipid II flippase FtsW [Candidatus Omnitrophota bacterium]
MVLRDIRINLFAITLILVCLGVVMIYSASNIYAWERYKDGAFFLKRHFIFFLIGILLTYWVMNYDYKKLAHYAKPFLIVSIILLLLVLIPGIGREVSGARRWFRFKFLSFQPSGLACLAVIIYTADFLSRKGKLIKNFWKGFLPPLAVLGLVSLLILAEPDLGTTLSIAMVVLVMLYIAGTRFHYLLSLVLLALPVLYLLIFHVAYRRSRILSFLNPWADPKGSGFQIIQSQIAIGSGGVFGVGLGHSKQKLFYLPAAHTDFIFSIIAEELGLLGTIGVIILFIMFIQQCLKIIKHAPNKFSYFLSLGLVLMITFKAMVNIGVSCGVLPTKGLPLPFISYGGSSFIFDMVSVGILLNIARTGEYP